MVDSGREFGDKLREAQRILGNLPPPDVDAMAHSQRLEDAIRAEMDSHGGAISFARFMELALYAPGLGYYAAGARKFGEHGDFVTAPEISPLFGRCIARQCHQVLETLNGGDILEFGAGSGALACQILQELERLGSLPERYFILEISPDLRARQQDAVRERLPQLLSCVRWLDTLPDPGFRGVVVANELLDAMPVHRFRIHEGEVQETFVTWRNEQLAWEYRMVDDSFARAVTDLQRDLDEPLAEGYESEISFAYQPWLKALGDLLVGGVVLLIDYGYPRREYYHPQRRAGTLMCHYRHRAHDNPLLLVGLQDITAYVDFTAVADAALAAGMELMGFTSQAHFLIGAGLDQCMAEANAQDDRAYLELARQAKILTLPGEMGERFKVMGLKKNIELTLSGFATQDLRGRL